MYLRRENSPLIDRISAEEREKILRINWWSHDGGWFFYTAKEVGFDVANKLNLPVNKSIEKSEMKRLLGALHIDQKWVSEHFFEIIEAVSDLYTKDVFEIKGLTRENDTTWIYRIKISQL